MHAAHPHAALSIMTRALCAYAIQRKVPIMSMDGDRLPRAVLKILDAVRANQFENVTPLRPIDRARACTRCVLACAEAAAGVIRTMPPAALWPCVRGRR